MMGLILSIYYPDHIGIGKTGLNILGSVLRGLNTWAYYPQGSQIWLHTFEQARNCD